MKTKSKVLITVTALLMIALVGVVIWLSVWVGMEKRNAETARRESENTYTYALYDSYDSVKEVENNLAKMLASDSEPENISIAADIYKDATAAAEVVGKLPVEMYKHEGLLKFLNQVGDFASSYIHAVGSGADVSAFENQIEDIYVAAENVRRILGDVIERVDSGDFSLMEQIDSQGFINITEGENNIEYPSIIYDGPFSDATEKSEWKAPKGMIEIDEQTAKKIAYDKLGVKGEASSLDGDEALYVVQGKAGDKDAYVSLTKRGGIIVNAMIDGEVGESKTDEKKAEAAALEYAAKMGYDDSLAPVWYNEIGGTAVVNLAPVIDGVVFYPDLVKIKVSLSDGSLLGVEACAYCTNHCDRDLPNVVMTKDSAKTCVSKRLTVTNVRLAVIPISNSERFCYEVSAEYKGLDYFVYVDAVTGSQVDVLRVIDDNQGTLVV